MGSSRKTPIHTYKEFQKVLFDICLEIGVKEIYWSRVDFRLDTDNPEYFDMYFKLHQALISCLSIANGAMNSYTTDKLLTGKKLNIAIKTNSIQVKNYDKREQSEGKDWVCARLEERSTKLRNKEIEQEFLFTWIERWKKAWSCFGELQQVRNMYLEADYKTDLEKNKRERQYKSLTDFVLANQDKIYTKSQLVDFFSRINEVKNPENRATEYKKNHAIEFFSLSDLKYSIKEIEKATQKYFRK